ncbi:hypothetical protein CJO79_11015 [Ralstonia solanacearum]|nr:hypothetical protein CJO76_11035 [Ralstonia solanacearum]AXV91469.1 hypothetical protein CJO79_11015 [Ralstonia solanacearum]AXW19595.1 hypothetical protein CJO85_11075 [Ralstonia solanacearum]AXW76365.1 hypothetical protein CJO97_11010 [Ralstonia solanacearum]
MAPLFILSAKQGNQSGFQLFIEWLWFVIRPVLKQREVIDVPIADNAVSQAKAVEVCFVLLQVE